MGGASGRKIFEGFDHGNIGGSDILADTECTNEHMREIQMGKEQRDLLKTANILLLGPIHTGKSSFVNSVVSICEGRKVGKAFTGGGEKSYTRKCVVYTETNFWNFRLADIKGLVQSGEEDFHVQDVMTLIKGHIKDNYEFQLDRSIGKSQNVDRAGGGEKSYKTSIDERSNIFVLIISDVTPTLGFKELVTNFESKNYISARMSTMVQWQGKNTWRGSATFPLNHLEDIYPKQTMEKRANKAALHDYEKIVRCSVCLDKVSCIILFPCRHMTACESCADAVTHCPVCRSLIKGTVKVDVQ